MKKIFLPIFVFLLSSLFILPGYAEEEVADQYQYEHNACYVANSAAYLNQTFQPTKNVLTKVMVKMANRDGSTVTMRIVDEVTSQVVVQVSRRMGLDDGWETFDLDTDSLGYILDIDHEHSIWIFTNVTGRDAPCWLYHQSDLYSYGTRRSGSVEETGDFTFYNFGYTLDMGRTNPDGDVGDDDEYVMTIEGDDDDTEVVVIDDTVGDVADTPVETTVEEDATEDESINAPEFGSVIVNDVVMELEDEDSVDTEDGDLVKITGTADAGNTVYVYIDDDTYSATADEDGNWYVIFNTETLEEGEYGIQALSENDGLKSEKVDLLTVVLGEEVDSNDTETAEEEDQGVSWLAFLNKWLTGEYRWYIFAGFLFLLILLAILLLWLLKKMKERKNVRHSKIR